MELKRRPSELKENPWVLISTLLVDALEDEYDLLRILWHVDGLFKARMSIPVRHYHDRY
jgi:hypothetical protein